MGITRTVKRVIDGDTFITSRSIGGTNKIRLANVDAPERGSYGGTKATNVLKGLIGRKSVSIIPVGRSYDRLVAEVIKDGRSINEEMQKRGY